MLKYSTVAEVGELIKAFDFEPCEGRPDVYLVGKVLKKGDVGVGYDAYLVECVYDSWDTARDSDPKHSRVGRKIFVPFEMMMLEYDNRVTKV